MKETKRGLKRYDEDGDEEDDKEDVTEEDDDKEDVGEEDDHKEDMDASCRNSNLPIKQLPLGKYARSSERLRKFAQHRDQVGTCSLARLMSRGQGVPLSV
ncbi:unnamed protein product [Nesidiocoris tenuis]|uniref:Uncharacterized protein n=1 Tax=Nesidiocoris tenuis TaxID=355587 RepID=A0A6H5H2H0_9HEMI|nr:unnamed protein product [Nesidiocoris tenuis]